MLIVLCCTGAADVVAMYGDQSESLLYIAIEAILMFLRFRTNNGYVDARPIG